MFFVYGKEEGIIFLASKKMPDNNDFDETGTIIVNGRTVAKGVKFNSIDPESPGADWEYTESETPGSLHVPNKYMYDVPKTTIKANQNWAPPVSAEEEEEIEIDENEYVIVPLKKEKLGEAKADEVFDKFGAIEIKLDDKGEHFFNHGLGTQRCAMIITPLESTVTVPYFMPDPSDPDNTIVIYGEKGKAMIIMLVKKT